MSQHRSTGRRGLFRVLGAAALVCAALVAPAIAHADTRTAQVTLSNPLVTPNLPFQTGFGVYNFTVSNVLPNETFPFASGIKFGHCVDLTHDAGSSAVTLETSTRLHRHRCGEPGPHPVAARVLPPEEPDERGAGSRAPERDLAGHEPR